MSDPKQPTFLVSAHSEPVVVRVNGKANYLNCSNFREFMEQMVHNGRNKFAVDFEHCKGMDSTFLGILAGTAIDLREQDPSGVLLVCNLSERNRELIRNLGLQALLFIDADLPKGERAVYQERNEKFSELEDKEISDARNVLEAHRNLVKANEKNEAKFQNVIAFLKNQVEPDS